MSHAPVSLGDHPASPSSPRGMAGKAGGRSARGRSATERIRAAVERRSGMAAAAAVAAVAVVVPGWSTLGLAAAVAVGLAIFLLSPGTFVGPHGECCASLCARYGCAAAHRRAQRREERLVGATTHGL